MTTTKTTGELFVSSALRILTCAAAVHGEPVRIKTGGADRGYYNVKYADGTTDSIYPSAVGHEPIVALRDSGFEAAADELCRLYATPSADVVRAAFAAAFPSAKLSIR